ncbi:flagellar hook-associated protein FlgL [Thalassotalea sp. PLHSN55]|uniref:flagellar hook-associated protein FlgL n=1 Tax=Thalassotalea sp. PLHSN55 TaxID=3435888 RepID=UPI003F873231
MRVSTAQFYFQNGLQMSDKQTTLSEQSAYLSSGKRVLTAKDDAVSYSALAGYKNELSNIEKYQRNITQAESRNNYQEVAFSNTTNILNELRDLLLQANNGVYAEADLASISQQATNSLKQVLDIANTKDETGGYIFSGFQIDKQPFALQPDNSVNYHGDNGERELQIAKNVMVGTNVSGEQAFEKVANNIGDFSAQYNANTSGIFVEHAVIARPGDNDTSAGAGYPTPYNFSFASETDLTITDNDGDVMFTTTTYTPGELISLPNGVDVQLGGNPLPGDDFDLLPQETISVFDTIKAAIDWIDVGTSPVSEVQHQVDYSTVLGQLNQALDHISSQRADAGIRLQLTDRQKNNHLDTELYLNSSRSKIEDLDFAKAISEFEQSQMALQAAQQTFTQIQNLSLFNYI